MSKITASKLEISWAECTELEPNDRTNIRVEKKTEDAKVTTSGEIKQWPLKKDGDNVEGYSK